MSEEPPKKMAKFSPKTNIISWIEENESSFAPPVCNKMMENEGQLKIMFVGGPNVRKDYHIEEGEELFWMVRGDMCVKIMERGVPKDVVIKEGEIFVLPGCIPHSPQRYANTVGLVIERERSLSEIDGLRYYTPESFEPQNEGKPAHVLWEKWFHCTDLGVQLGPVIKEFFASKEHASGIPSKESVMEKIPLTLDETTVVHKPFSVDQWLTDHKDSLKKGPVKMFGSGEFQVTVFTKSTSTVSNRNQTGQIWLWQYRGSSSLSVDEKDAITLDKHDSVLVKANESYSWSQRGDDSIGIEIIMTPKKRS